MFIKYLCVGRRLKLPREESRTMPQICLQRPRSGSTVKFWMILWPPPGMFTNVLQCGMSNGSKVPKL